MFFLNIFLYDFSQLEVIVLFLSWGEKNNAPN